MANKQVNFADDLLMSPAYLAPTGQGPPLRGDFKAAAEKKEREDVAKAKNDLHKCLTLTLNKLIAPLLVQKCWNYAVDEKQISYAQSASICFAIACIKSFANFSLSDK